jgi:hypothetical protein
MLVAGPVRCFRLIQAMDKSNVGDTLPRLRWSLDLPGTDAGRQRKHGYVQFHSFPDLPTLLRCRRLSVCCCCSLSTSYFPLHEIPGPLVAAISGVWLWIWDITGSAPRDIKDLHRSLGMSPRKQYQGSISILFAAGINSRRVKDQWSGLGRMKSVLTMSMPTIVYCIAKLRNS